MKCCKYKVDSTHHLEDMLHAIYMYVVLPYALGPVYYIMYSIHNFMQLCVIVFKVLNDVMRFYHVSAETVINSSIRSAFEYSGQKCSAASRMYIPESLWPRVSTWAPSCGCGHEGGGGGGI